MSTMQCLVIMPFKGAFDPVYQTVQATIAIAVPGGPIDCYWLKDIYATLQIADDILDSIHKAVLCVSDLTDSNPNVMWETGLCDGPGKTHGINEPTRGYKLPFDLKVHRVLPYDQNALEELHRDLRSRLSHTCSRRVTIST